MAECLCPKCGYVWDHDGVPPTDEMKRAVRAHLDGEADSVVSAIMEGRRPELEAKQARVIGFCEPEDLARYRADDLLVSITEGDIYAWEPGKLWAADLVQVLRIEHRDNGDIFVWTKSPGEQRELYNDFSRCQEAFVRTNLKHLPDRI